MGRPWHLAAATRPGPPGRAVANQDAYTTWTSDDGATVVVAVADGAGSLPESHEGSTRAVAAAVEAARILAAKFPRAAVALAHQWARAALGGRREWGCTLAVFAASPAGWAASVIGDSFVVVHHADGSHRLVISPPAGEFANLTQLLSSSEVEPTTASGPSDDVVGLSAATDGVADAALTFGPDGETVAHPGFFTPLRARTAAGTLDAAALLEHTAAQELIDDDATLVVAARASGGGELIEESR